MGKHKPNAAEVSAVGPVAQVEDLGSLYKIDTTLSELIAMSELCEDLDEKRVIDVELEKYVAAHVAKVGAVLSYAKYSKAMIGVLETEVEGARSRLKGWSNRLDRLKSSVKGAMEAVGATRYECPTGRIRVQANGGAEPGPEVDMASLPDKYQLWPCDLSLGQISALEKAFGREAFHISDAIKPNMERIKFDLLLSCYLQCDEGKVDTGTVYERVCPRCGGSGRNEIPGVTRSTGRGTHVRFE